MIVTPPEAATEPDPRLIALYLPQFHPIPENDAWWGRGFTEWTNVTQARPLFRGHDQPRRPADLGYYDLRLPEARAAQADLARAYGVHGFCYYHYWFSGRRLLERPFAEVLDRGEPDLPFCLCWANEVWSRRWLGEERDVLMPQAYSEEDDRTHGRWLARAFADSRYIRVDGRPLFLIWRMRDFPEPRATLDRLREAVRREGVAEPWIVGVDAHCSGTDLRGSGADATLEFAPQLGRLPGALQDGPSAARAVRNLRLGKLDARLKLYGDAYARARMEARDRSFPLYPTCYVGWDNSPRRGRDGVIIVGSTPERFEEALGRAVARAGAFRGDERLVFINAWNEWAEGAYLEPDARYGRGFLEAVSRVVRKQATPSPRRKP